ncbi:STAS domain-containing protein [Streptomyces sp. NPDC004082]|uniref:STAS domain-containing protein n=1 Tax=unclassified Streptomyces TaxID=2593676 RepID=UPI0033AE80AF
MPVGLSVQRDLHDGVAVVSVRGEIDQSSIEPLREALVGGSAPARRTVIDLGEVSFMDSTGLNLLLDVHLAASNDGGWVRLANVSERVSRILEIVGVNQVIPVYATLRLALTA